MTTALDAVAEFRRLLPAQVGRQLHDTQRLVALLARATDQGWTPKHLAQECGRDLGGVTNAPAVAMWRLEQAAAHPPPHQAAKTRQRLCGRCEDGFLVDPGTRLPVERCECRRAGA